MKARKPSNWFTIQVFVRFLKRILSKMPLQSLKRLENVHDLGQMFLTLIILVTNISGPLQPRQRDLQRQRQFQQQLHLQFHQLLAGNVGIVMNKRLICVFHKGQKRSVIRVTMDRVCQKLQKKMVTCEIFVWDVNRRKHVKMQKQKISGISYRLRLQRRDTTGQIHMIGSPTANPKTITTLEAAHIAGKSQPSLF